MVTFVIWPTIVYICIVVGYTQNKKVPCTTHWSTCSLLPLIFLVWATTVAANTMGSKAWQVEGESCWQQKSFDLGFSTYSWQCWQHSPSHDWPSHRLFPLCLTCGVCLNSFRWKSWKRSRYFIERKEIFCIITRKPLFFYKGEYIYSTNNVNKNIYNEEKSKNVVFASEENTYCTIFSYLLTKRRHRSMCGFGTQHCIIIYSKISRSTEIGTYVDYLYSQ